MFLNVCRLCKGTRHLIWLFDDNLCKGMAEMVKIATGVEIIKEDPISQMLCRRCCQIVLKICTFRGNSIKNDNDLRAKHMRYSIFQLTNSSYIKEERQSVASTSTDTKIESSDDPPKSLSVPQEKVIHLSVKEVMQKEPNLQIPKDVFNLNIDACISVSRKEVDDWFDQNNYSPALIEEIKEAALKMTDLKLTETDLSENTGPKCTLPLPKRKNDTVLEGESKKRRSDHDQSYKPIEAVTASTSDTTPLPPPGVPSRDTSGPSDDQLGSDYQKTAFVLALQLLPKGTVGSNVPDMSLITVANNRTLFTCNICYHHVSNERMLRSHMQKVHTRCPFCHQRFRTLTERENHIEGSCKEKTNRMKVAKVGAEARVSENEVTIKLVNKDLCCTLFEESEDAIFEQVKHLHRLSRCQKECDWDVFNNEKIVPGPPNQITFKNLAKRLKQCAGVPLEFKHSSNVTLRYVPITKTCPKSVDGIWLELEPRVLLIKNDIPEEPQASGSAEVQTSEGYMPSPERNEQRNHVQANNAQMGSNRPERATSLKSVRTTSEAKIIEKTPEKTTLKSVCTIQQPKNIPCTYVQPIKSTVCSRPAPKSTKSKDKNQPKETGQTRSPCTTSTIQQPKNIPCTNVQPVKSAACSRPVPKSTKNKDKSQPKETMAHSKILAGLLSNTISSYPSSSKGDAGTRPTECPSKRKGGSEGWGIRPFVLNGALKSVPGSYMSKFVIKRKKSL